VRCGLKLGYQGGQSDQVRDSKVRASGRYDSESVFGLDARPARRQGGDVAEAVAIEDQVIAPSDPSLYAVDLLTEEWMKGVRDPDR